MFREMGMNTDTANILTASWATTTQKQYTLVLRRWIAYCTEHGIEPARPTVLEGINYLQELFTGGAAHTTVNTARSLLSTFVTVGDRPFGEHPLVARLLKGISNLKPTGPRYDNIWDPKLLLNYVQAWGSTHELDCERLNKRTTCLYLLATGQRLQALSRLRRKDIRWEEDGCTIKYSTRMKSNDPAKNPLILSFRKFEVPELCVFEHLKCYMAREELKGAGPAVFATTRRPHVRASQDTLTRYVRTTMQEAGVDMSIFTPYSCRHAATSAAMKRQVPLATILQSAGWIGEGTFQRFYNRPLAAQAVNTNLIPAIWKQTN